MRTACSIAILAALANAARADDDQVETVTVTGVQYSVVKSIDAKLNANIVSDSISADEISSIPEFGLGDALRKVPGVSLQINNGRGEDQFATVRGFNPDYDTTTVDGMPIASTEETTRWVSLDVIPSVVINGADVNKTWRVDQPTDAIGGIIDLHTRSAFDHPGLFFEAHLDGAYWEDHEVIHSELPSGQGDVTLSDTFGPNNEFGFLVLASYWQRSSSTLNTYTLPWSYYPYSGSGTVTENAIGQNGSGTGSTLSPSTSTIGLIGIPDRHRWYFYDNDRYRPGYFGRFDFDDHSMFHAHIEGGFFQFINNENRHSAYLNRVGPVTITSDTTGSFSEGYADVDYDKYVQNREVEFVDGGAGMNFGDDMHLDLDVNYSVGHYSQFTDEDEFLYGSSSHPQTSLAFTYNLAAPTAPLFTPENMAAFMNPANYVQQYHLNAVDTSTNYLPQVKVEFTDHYEADAQGLGFKAGFYWRELFQHYLYNQSEYTPNSAVTLAQIGVINRYVPLYDGEGQTLLLLDPNAVNDYVEANLSDYTLAAATDKIDNTVNNYTLEETVKAGYLESQFRQGAFYGLLGLRYEVTDQDIGNYLPVPNQPASNPEFQFINSSSSYAKLLPSLNMFYDLTDELKLRGAVTQTLARPEYAQLAENSTSSLNVSGGIASETISNPDLLPRKSTNFDMSTEWYWAPGAVASIALFNKQIKNEIETLTTTTQNAIIPGYNESPGEPGYGGPPVELTTTTSENAGSAVVQGLELNAADAKFEFLPWFLSDFGGSANVTFVTFDSPDIRMSNGTFRKLPQLLYSSRTIENLSLFYANGPYSGEITYNYTAKMPISFDTNNKVNDQWWRGISTVDTQLRYAIADNVFLRLQGKNLFDSRPQKVVGLTQQDNYSTLENGRAYYFGVGVVF